MAMNPVTGDAAFGFADGSIKIFTIEDEGRFGRQLVALDAAAYLRKSINQTQVITLSYACAFLRPHQRAIFQL